MPGPRKCTDCNHRWRQHEKQEDGTWRCTSNQGGEQCTCTNEKPWQAGP